MQSLPVQLLFTASAVYPGAIDDHPYRAITGKDRAIKVFYRVKKKQFEEPKATTRRSLPLNMDQKAIDVTLKGGRKTKQIPFRDLYLGAEEGRTSFAVYDKKRHGPGLKTKRVELHGEGAVTAVMTNREGVLK